MPHIGDDPATDIPLWVPGGKSDLTPLQAAFIMQANSTLEQLQRVLKRQRSQVLYTDKFKAGQYWETQGSKLRIVGEVWGYFELTIKRITKKLVVPANGNFKPVVIGQITDTAMTPQSLAALSSSKSGRLAVGHALNNGEVKLDAVSTGSDIAVNEIITLAGAWPLDDWLDSEV